MDWKKEILETIQEEVAADSSQVGGTPRWRWPLVGFARGEGPEILALGALLGPGYMLPGEVLPGGKIVVCYFLPFTKELAVSNKTPGKVASPQWAAAYEDTNKLIRRINRRLMALFEEHGVPAREPMEAYRFDTTRLVSRWSQRHYAYLAGLGTFGLNNMLITSAGCCGRFGSVVTALEVEADRPCEEEACLFKTKGTCKVCVARCPSGALTTEGFQRDLCYGVLKENALRYPVMEGSYDDGGAAGGSDVCGKCTTCIPCGIL